MRRNVLFAPLVAASAMALAAGTPAYAGKADRARSAIAAADAKIQTAETMGAGSELPPQTSEARAALAMAKEKLSAGHKSTSISEAIRASALADAAIGEMQSRQERAIADERQSRREVVAAAQDQAAYSRQQAASAQQETAAANARANVADQSAAISANDAAAARDAALVATTMSPQVETTVTTVQPVRLGTRAPAKTTVTRRPIAPVTAPAGDVTTTTTVTRPGR